MTTADEARRGTAEARSDAGRTVVTAEPAPALHERLYAAREHKGVDLYRAERDTKIRARYLGALERGDYKELPGAVYTKGFLRNYALYLGLDPEDVLRQWRREQGDVKEAEPIVVPQPLTAPRQGLTFSPGIVWAGLLTIGVIAFAAYLGLQLLRYNKPPTLAVTDPSVAVTTVGDSATTYTLRGTSIPGATISIASPGREQPYRVSAAADGTWTAEVELRRGPNQFDINATDPETGKGAEKPAQLVIRVPFLVIEAPTLKVDQPADGATFENGAISVRGVTTHASTVIVSASYVGPAAAAAPATPASPATPPAKGASPRPSAAASPPPAPGPVTVQPAADGSFATPFDLTTGNWTLTVTAASTDGKSIAVTRSVTVRAVTVAHQGVNLVVMVKAGRVWLKVWIDGQIAASLGPDGGTIRAGHSLTFTGLRSIEVRTGSSGLTYFTLNGTSLGSLGPSGIPETWLFAPPDPPLKTKRT